MAIWELRIDNANPIRFEVPDARNIAAEFRTALDGYHAAGAPRRFWQQAPEPTDTDDGFWHVTPDIAIHLDTVTAVLICKPHRAKSDLAPSKIGFTAERRSPACTPTPSTRSTDE